MGQSPPLEGFEADTYGAVHPAPRSWASWSVNPSSLSPRGAMNNYPGAAYDGGTQKKMPSPGGEEDVSLVEAVSRGALEPVSVKLRARQSLRPELRA